MQQLIWILKGPWLLIKIWGNFPNTQSANNNVCITVALSFLGVYFCVAARNHHILLLAITLPGTLFYLSVLACSWAREKEADLQNAHEISNERMNDIKRSHIILLCRFLISQYDNFLVVVGFTIAASQLLLWECKFILFTSAMLLGFFPKS